MSRSTSTILVLGAVALGAVVYLTVQSDEAVAVDPAIRTQESTSDRDQPRDLQGFGSKPVTGTEPVLPEKPAAKKPVEKPAPEPQAPLTDLAQKLGSTNEEAKEAEEWYRPVATVQSQHLDTLADGGGSAAAEEFNKVMADHRKAAIDKFGVDRANRILAEFPVYMFELGGGTLFQVDAQGVKIPFTDPKMRDAFSNFERKR